MVCGFYVATNMLSLVSNTKTYKNSAICTLHSVFMHLSLILFIYDLPIYIFIKHAILQDYKAAVLCEFIVKDVIPPDSRFYHALV